MQLVMYISLGLVLITGGVLLGWVLTGKHAKIKIGRVESQILNYQALTPESKKMVNGYVEARTRYDENKHYKLRGKSCDHE
ncbi:TMhelix containing protein [Vibrio phage 1.079.O._10N.286.45.E9]|nr:TMhelix containing protein [Vibrio phage 1.079.O._10N.286.45.E9]